MMISWIDIGYRGRAEKHQNSFHWALLVADVFKSQRKSTCRMSLLIQCHLNVVHPVIEAAFSQHLVFVVKWLGST